MVVLRWVDDTLVVHEYFIGLYSVPTIQASTIVSAVRDTLVRLNLSVSKVRGQCYDGASNMSGIKKGVATQLQVDEPRAIYTHCYGHSLNLAAADTIKRCKTMKTAMKYVMKSSSLLSIHQGEKGFLRI